MPNCKSKSCKCCSKRYVSCGIDKKGKCLDVCTDPICGDPDCLTVLTPVVYDELGINLCRNIPLELPVTNVDSISVQVMDITFDTTGDTAVTAVPINGRPNCYLITLTNLSVTFYVTLYDCARRVLGTQTVTANYLPADDTSADYDYMDEDTNPTSVELEIFAPYGVAHSDATGLPAIINVIGFGEDNTALSQGLNLLAIPKVLNFDPQDSTVTIGLSVILKSVYFSQYKIPHDDTICLDFVCGDLLDLAIKPLELGPPKYEETLKDACDVPCDPCCNPPTSTPVVPNPDNPEENA